MNIHLFGKVGRAFDRMQSGQLTSSELQRTSGLTVAVDRLPELESIVVTRLIGGLGNQMFQYAAGLALAQRHRVELKLDVSGFAAYPKRHYELGSFPIRGIPASEAELAFFGWRRPKVEPRWLARARRFIRSEGKPGPSPIYREQHFHFDRRVRDLNPTVYLDGYWQSEKYFADWAGLLRQEFTPLAPLEPENAAMADRIDAVNAVSLHVRRGDYVNEPDISRYHGIALQSTIKAPSSTSRAEREIFTCSSSPTTRIGCVTIFTLRCPPPLWQPTRRIAVSVTCN